MSTLDIMDDAISTTAAQTLIQQLLRYSDQAWSKRFVRPFPDDADWTPSPSELRAWQEDAARNEMRAAQEVVSDLRRNPRVKDIPRAEAVLSGRFYDAMEGSGSEE